MKLPKEKNMIFGIRAVIEAIEAGKEIDKIFLRRDMGGELARELFERLKPTNIPVQRVPPEKLNRLTTKNHQGAVAFLAAVEYQQLENIVPTIYESGHCPFIVLLDGITDIRNFGAIARTCECAGVDALVVPSHGGATINADAIKTSAGALHTLPVCRERNLREAVLFLKNSGVKVFAASEKAKNSYTKANFTEPTALIMGAEDVGVSPEILRLCDDTVAIPILGKIESLNVSVASAIMIYEVIRQRNN